MLGYHISETLLFLDNCCGVRKSISHNDCSCSLLENAASEVPVSAHKYVYSQTHLCELRMFSSTVVFLPHCCVLLLKVILLF